MRFSLHRLLQVIHRRSMVTPGGGPLSNVPASLQTLEQRVLLSADGLVGDANGDGRVDLDDVDMVKANWNASAQGAGAQAGDLDGDGFVGLGDLNMVLGSADFNATTVDVQAAQSQSQAAQTEAGTQTLAGYYTDFNGTITGNWVPTFDRDLPTVDPAGQLVGADQPRWGDAVGVSAAEAWELVLTRNNAVYNIGYGPGADGQWLSIWADAGTNEFIAFNHDLTQWKVIGADHDDKPAWLTQADWETDTRYIPKTGQIVPGGLWVTYLQRDQDKDASPSSQDWEAVGTSFGVVQEVTFDNVFTQPRTILDTPRAQGLIDSTTGEPYPNDRGREWAMSLTPIVVNGRVEQVWYTFTDYMQDTTVPVHKPGGTTWVFLAERDAAGDHYTVRQPRIIEQQEDPAGKDNAFEHRHSAITVVHDTGEVDVIVASGDTAPHSFTKRYRINDPANYETSTLTAQLTGFLGVTGEVSPKLISFQVGSAPNKVLAATDGRHEAVLELTIPVDITAPAEVRSVLNGGFNKSAALTVNLELAKPWQRSGYMVSVRPFNGLTPIPFPATASTFFYSEDGYTWVEIASNVGQGEIVFHDDILVTRDTDVEQRGIYKMPLSAVGMVNPLLVSPGGVQRLSSSLTQQTAYNDTGVTFLERVNGLWVDNGVPLTAQPPTLGPVIKISKTGNLDSVNLTRLFLSGTDADFQAGGYALKIWVMSAEGYSPYLISGVTSPGGGGGNLYQPTDNQGWVPILDWGTADPNGDGSDYTAIGRLASHFNGDPHHVEMYVAYDLLLNQADTPGTVAPAADLDHDAFVGISDLTSLLADWNKSSLPVVVPGDFNEDGFVGIIDLTTVLSNWNTSVTPGDLSAGDGTGDGFVGIEDLNFVLTRWNTGQLPPDPYEADLNNDGLVGIADLNELLSDWNTFRPTTGLVPGYSISPNDLSDIAAAPEKLTWGLPTPTNGAFTAALAMNNPMDGIDGSWGEDDFSNGSTNYGTLYADDNNYIELWNHRESRTWAFVVIENGVRTGVATFDEAWINVDGRLHWAVSYEPGQGLRVAILNHGNEVETMTINVNLSFIPTQLRIGSHDWLSVPTVGIKSAFYNPDNAETLPQLSNRVFQDAIYL